MKRERRNAGQWTKILAEIDSSGISTAEFARQQKLSLSSIYQWRKRLKRNGTKTCPSTAEPVSFIEVVPEEAPQGAAAAWLEIGGNLVLRFNHLPDPDYITMLSRKLEE